VASRVKTRRKPDDWVEAERFIAEIIGKPDSAGDKHRKLF
jgi:hypothetical protein